MQDNKSLRFPKDFLWGVSVSAHQVEGGNHSQWTKWELENAKALAAQAKRRYSHLDNWEDIKAAATDPNNYVSGEASRHYELYKQDFKIAKQLGMNTFRFSIEWSRVEPSEGAWSTEAIDHYRSYLKELRAQGLEPVMSLFHFTLPVWFAEKGGFEKRRNVAYFVRFVQKIMEELGSHVTYVITLNEPMIYADQSYRDGIWPPQMLNRVMFARVVLNLVHAHNQAAKAIKAINSRTQVTLAYHSVYFYGGDDALLTRISANVMQYFSDDFFLSRVVKRCDFLAINYYFSNRVYGYRIHNEDRGLSDLGWNRDPENVEYVLERIYKKYKLPVLVAENGLADSKDAMRKEWLIKTLAGVQRATDRGVPVMGYIHWSLLDNFEWAHGKWPRFGLVEVDYRTQKRKVRRSAIWYSKVIKHIRSDS